MLMRTNVQAATLAAASLLPLLLSGALPARARAEDGLYLAVHAGPNFLQGEDLDLDDGGRIEPDYRVGYHVGGAAGYGFGPLSVEAEVAHQRHDVDGGDSGGLAAEVGGLDGNARILSFLVNGYYDVDIGHPLTPFVGAGAGVARVRLDDVDATVAVGGVSATAELFDDADTVFAAQAVVGVSFDVNETWTTAFAYRFFAALGAEFDAGGPLDDSSAEADFFSHALRFEARYRF